MTTPTFSYEYGITYGAFDLLCIVLYIVMLSQTNRSMGNRIEITIMRGLIVISALSALTQAVDAFGRIGMYPYPLSAVFASNGLDLLATLYATYFWFLLMNYKSSRRFFSRRIPQLLSMTPLIIMTVINIMSFWTGYTFTVLPDGTYVRGPLYILQIIACYSYFLFSTGICFDGYLHGNVMERDLFKKLFLFSLFPIIGGLFQVIIATIPFTAAAMIVSIFYTFIRLQDQRINTDAMTALNNKLCTQRYIEHMSRTAKQEPFFLFMLDVNHFKQVNDTYGHLMGDNVLIAVADALKRTASTIGGFVGRFGGDEFTIILRQSTYPVPDGLQEILNRKIKQIIEDRNLGVEVTISVGWSLCEKNDEQVSDIISKADAMLYEVKRNR